MKQKKILIFIKVPILLVHVMLNPINIEISCILPVDKLGINIKDFSLLLGKLTLEAVNGLSLINPFVLCKVIE
jgi:hypothetical protein